MMTLHFYPPSYDDFPALRLGREAGIRGGSMTTVFNAANEEAVRLFLEDRIPFLAIPVLIERTMHAHEGAWISYPEVEEIIEIEKWSRAFVLSEADKGVFILD